MAKVLINVSSMMQSKKTIWILLFLFLSLLQQVQAQDTSTFLNTLPLRDLGAFKPADASWKIVGDVWVNREKAGHIKTSTGEGILLSSADKGRQERLETDWQHQDIDLELEFILTKGASRIALIAGGNGHK